MNKEQPPIVEKKEEVSLDEIRAYLEQRKDFYLEHEIGDISSLLEELKEQKHENTLRFFERIVGQPTEIIRRGSTQIDLISEKIYPAGKFGKEDKDIKKASYKEKKEYLRKVVKKLTREYYKDRENFDHLTAKEYNEILGHMANSVDYGGEKFIETKEKFEKGDYSDLFDYIDFRVAKTLKNVKRLEKQGDEEGAKHESEFLEELRRARLFFPKMVEARKNAREK